MYMDIYLYIYIYIYIHAYMRAYSHTWHAYIQASDYSHDILDREWEKPAMT